ncbi:trehalose-6-phosphate synthase [Corynebacterium sp. 320]|uniref:alpha,alpha-trehalose-phosphate synthase (UDP-forming) n=1 Tax=Corynebacterium TaxID=1716 RepID=UPI00125CB633|nr:MULTISPECIES: trehalose-6-phosphate synthase [Corynebacterium]KAB1503024.1 trehalose-6-phosphate synthase [Corynebacterium sp. 320]KAB1550767.1 trehalose-6-phosphate synthase [Corynebacterium sp. 321]KAB1551124.1 trehalose-6-phosphate synthase [Corynebacterium sp. 319]KAB3526821.1 trehalose-6-phosphate synthase [Corynebacterium sp. 250]KAB3538314.1 trehalose-6-phosphate synthase [Corynebacterium sp. 366]
MTTPVKSDFVVVANRLPVDRTTDKKTGEEAWTPSPGGLVTALRPVLTSHDGAWVGWPGSTDTVTVEDMPTHEEAGITMMPVNLNAQDFEEFYEGFSNGCLWPLYHDLIVKPSYNKQWWKRYAQVNQHFANACSEVLSEDATVWVQDYQLHLVPGMLRARHPKLRIGFFLHIPFPSPELFRQLPWRRDILEGTLGADLVGFHTQDSARNFMITLRALGYEVEILDDDDNAAFLRGARLPDSGHTVGYVRMDDARTVTVGVFPISIDSTKVQQQAITPDTRAAADRLREELGNPRFLLAGVDRMDYTKGILHRLTALEKLLDEGTIEPKDVVMIQVATPSRERLNDYRVSREEVEKVVTRINGNHGSLTRPVVQYVHTNLPFTSLLALYTATDLMLVTALKDGMNLVAKEYVACHSDGSGALVLSEFTGAATQLVQAHLCNPYDPDSIGLAIQRAMAGDPEDKKHRMRAMWEHVRVNDVDHWAQSFLEQL